MWNKKKIQIPVEISARHCHLSKEVLEKLFGVGYELKKMRQLSMPSDFAAEETVEVLFGSKKIEKVRVVGPLRAKTQVEISLTDAIGSGVIPPIKLSGDLVDSSSITLIGPKGSVELAEGLIVALRHLHCNEMEAAQLRLKNDDKISVVIDGLRRVTFENVAVRVRNDYNLCLHLDTDEGNAAGINKISNGIIL